MLAAYQSDQLLRLFLAWRTAASSEDQVSCTCIHDISLMYFKPLPSRCYCLQIRRATHTLEQQRIRMAVRAWRVNSRRQQVTFLKILSAVECYVASQIFILMFDTGHQTNRAPDFSIARSNLSVKCRSYLT